MKTFFHNQPNAGENNIKYVIESFVYFCNFEG